MKKNTFFKTSFKYGVFLGLGFCLYTALSWFSKLDITYLEYGQYMDIAIILWPIFVIFWAIRQEKGKYLVTTIQRIGVAIIIRAISFIIYDPFLYVYHHYINPEWYSAVLSLNQLKMNTNAMLNSEIADALQKMKDSDIAKAALLRLSALISSVIVVPVVISFLLMIFIKNN